MQAPSQTPKPEAILDESSRQHTPGQKRAIPESEGHSDEGSPGSGKKQADDAGLPSPKRLKAAVSSTEADETAGSLSNGPAPSQADNAAVHAPPRAHAGWNRGITSGLRTSFAAKDKLRRPLSRQASGSPVQPLTGSIDVDSLAMPSATSHLSGAIRRDDWQALFMKWCVRLMAINQSQKGLKDDPALLREAWGLWLETKVSLPRAHRTTAMEVAKETCLDAEKLQAMFSEALETDLQNPWDAPPTITGQAESVETEKQSNGQPASAESAPAGGQETNDWVLPPPPSCADFDVRHKDQRGWEERFVAWCKSLIQLNGQKIKVDTIRERNRVAELYLRWVGTIEGLSKAKAAAARRTAIHYVQDNSALLTALFAGTSPGGELQTTTSVLPPPNDPRPSPTGAVSDGEDETSGGGGTDLLEEKVAAYREKYFPGLGPNETICHMCASRDHDATECPETACRFCGDDGHRSFGCPTRLRCTKCKQLGHQKKDCTEKLALPPDEVECIFCQSRDHVDASCHEIWRSFKFNPATVRRVRSLPVFCYCCGSEGHYGPACGLNPQRGEGGPWETWSQANCDRYQDPASSDVATVFEAPSTSSGPRSERPDFGKSIVPQRHIFFEDTDDDDEAEEFIRPPVRKIMRFGHISFPGSKDGGNRSGRGPSSQQHNDKNGRLGYTQPPLPPGPPPPLPPQGHQVNGRSGGRRRGGGRR
ncbi:uncharacterized protein P884DRAFT_261789 [Thermothelomyces heterothallicus CBS 202.75]|uniref:uncharacterized protein n=1 Tax=Thermothelomyces heterothallicus CBS 202.75 TaxID=1149848 RepID=UPI0037444995